MVRYQFICTWGGKLKEKIDLSNGDHSNHHHDPFIHKRSSHPHYIRCNDPHFNRLVIDNTAHQFHLSSLRWWCCAASSSVAAWLLNREPIPQRFALVHPLYACLTSLSSSLTGQQKQHQREVRGGEKERKELVLPFQRYPINILSNKLLLCTLQFPPKGVRDKGNQDEAQEERRAQSTTFEAENLQPSSSS